MKILFLILTSLVEDIQLKSIYTHYHFSSKFICISYLFYLFCNIHNVNYLFICIIQLESTSGIIGYAAFDQF